MTNKAVWVEYLSPCDLKVNSERWEIASQRFSSTSSSVRIPSYCRHVAMSKSVVVISYLCVKSGA